MITKIAIENFKGIGDLVKVELRPITLLFGANNAGKSSILQALHYAREVLERHNLDPDRTVAGGRYVDLGGFLGLVHGHERERPVTIALDLSFGDRGFPHCEHDDRLFHEFVEPYSNVYTGNDLLFGEPSSATIQATVCWSELLNGPFVRSYRLRFDGGDFAEITAEPESRGGVFTLLDPDHPLLTRPEVIDPTSDHMDAEQFNEYLSDIGSRQRSGHSLVHSILDQLGGEFAPYTDRPYSFLLTGQADALPCAGQELQFAYSELGGRENYEKYGVPLNSEEAVHPGPWAQDRAGEAEKQEVRRYRWLKFWAARELARRFDHLVRGPLRCLVEELGKIRYLGPLREVPPRDYVPPRFRDDSRWASGLGAWDTLQSCDDELVQETSRWLADPECLDAGVRLKRHRYKEVEVSESAVSEGRMEGTLGKASRKTRRQLDQLPMHSRLVIVPTQTDIELRPHDLGVGISQLVPVVVTALADRPRLVVIEQPELHLHPRLQANLGDLFVEAATGERKQTVILETHSEHLLLRLLRRIREASEGTLPDECQSLKPDQLAVLYVESVDGDVRVTQLHVTEDGDFAGTWPAGFFDERAKELF